MSLENELQKLVDLYKAGALSNNEFTQAKLKLFAAARSGGILPTLRKMVFTTLITEDSEVVLPPSSPSVRTLEKGRWWIDMNKFSKAVTAKIADDHFGNSIDNFIFGFELGNLTDFWFSETRDYVSYRPQREAIISVGQISWPDVKDLTPDAQLLILRTALVASILRIADLKRKPKDFNYHLFAKSIETAIDDVPISMIT